eukprot:14311622-Alexandrium_andersonii.AAC.1
MEADLNVDTLFDGAHACHNDFNLMLKATGNWTHAQLKLNEWNVQHGPWGEDIRQSEIMGCWESTFKRFKRPQDCPLFMHFLPGMLVESGDVADVGDPSVADKYWLELQHSSPFGRKGCKANMNRFL